MVIRPLSLTMVVTIDNNTEINFYKMYQNTIKTTKNTMQNQVHKNDKYSSKRTCLQATKCLIACYTIWVFVCI